jgi:hypothetical protein
MKLKRNGELRQPKPRSREVLEVEHELEPWQQLEALIQECKLAMRELIQTTSETRDFLVYGRRVLEVYPELWEEFAPKSVDWEKYKTVLRPRTSGDYFAGAVVFFPERRFDMRRDFSSQLDSIGFESNGMPSMTSFRAAYALFWIKPLDRGRWTQLMDQAWQAAFQQKKRASDVFTRIAGAGELLVHKPELRPELQAMVGEHFSAVRGYIHKRLADRDYQMVCTLLHDLSIIFAEQVTADDSGRLTIQKKVGGVGKVEPLPARSAV